MADTSLADKARALYAEREAANTRCLIPKTLPVFINDGRPLQFWDYFYDWEQELLRSNDDERIAFRIRRTDKFFKDGYELEDYLENMRPHDESSNAEDRPPPSEELFLSDDKVYDHVMNSTKYCPQLKQMQIQLLAYLSIHVFQPGDTIDEITRKRAIRIELIRGYCKELKRKRYARTYHRFRTIRNMKLRLKDEALALCEEEHYNKGLTKRYYYDRDEPSEMKTVLQHQRSRAVQRKYKQYVTDPDFRRSYRNQVYYNVNQRVPSADDLHMHGHTVLVYDDNVDKVQANRSIYGPEAQMHSVRVQRIDSPNRSTLNKSIARQELRSADASSRSRSMSPTTLEMLKKHGLDVLTH